jgi:DNA polymerase III gamma/tau subunit
LVLIDQVLETGHDPGLLLNNLMEQVRDLLLLKIVSDPARSLGLAEDDLKAMSALKDRFSREDLLRIIDALAREEARIRYSPQPRYLLEALAVRLCHLTHLEPLEDLLARFPPGSGAVREAPKPSAPRKPSAGPEAQPMAVPNPPVFAAAPATPGPDASAMAAAPPEEDSSTDERPIPAGDDAPDARRQVETILEKIHAERSALWGFLSHAAFFDLTETAFLISLPEDKSVFRSSIERKEYLAVIRATVEAVTGRKVEVRVQLVAPLPAEAGGAGVTGSPQEEKKQKLIQEATQSPIVKDLLDLFQGEITEIEEV